MIAQHITYLHPPLTENMFQEPLPSILELRFFLRPHFLNNNLISAQHALRVFLDKQLAIEADTHQMPQVVRYERNVSLDVWVRRGPYYRRERCSEAPVAAFGRYAA